MFEGRRKRGKLHIEFIRQYFFNSADVRFRGVTFTVDLKKTAV